MGSLEADAGPLSVRYMPAQAAVLHGSGHPPQVPAHCSRRKVLCPVDEEQVEEDAVEW